MSHQVDVVGLQLLQTGFNRCVETFGSISSVVGSDMGTVGPQFITGGELGCDH